MRSSGDPKGALARSWVSLGGSGDVLEAFFSLLDGSCRSFGRPPTDACNVASEIRDVASVDGA